MIEDDRKAMASPRAPQDSPQPRMLVSAMKYKRKSFMARLHEHHKKLYNLDKVEERNLASLLLRVFC